MSKGEALLKERECLQITQGDIYRTRMNLHLLLLSLHSLFLKEFVTEELYNFSGLSIISIKMVRLFLFVFLLALNLGLHS